MSILSLGPRSSRICQRCIWLRFVKACVVQKKCPVDLPPFVWKSQTFVLWHKSAAAVKIAMSCPLCRCQFQCVCYSNSSGKLSNEKKIHVLHNQTLANAMHMGNYLHCLVLCHIFTGCGILEGKKTHSFPGRKKDLQNDKLRLRLAKGVDSSTQLKLNHDLNRYHQIHFNLSLPGVNSRFNPFCCWIILGGLNSDLILC